MSFKNFIVIIIRHRFTMKDLIASILLISALCIYDCRCRPSSTGLTYRQGMERSPRHLNNGYIVRQAKALKRRKRTGGGSDPTTTTEGPYEYAQVIPYINTGSTYLDGDKTEVKAKVFNIGYYNWPYYLSEKNYEGHHYYPPRQYQESQNAYDDSDEQYATTAAGPTH